MEIERDKSEEDEGGQDTWPPTIPHVSSGKLTAGAER